MSYVELHARSAFSFLRGASLPEDYARTAREQHLKAVALCDRDGVYGTARFHTAAKEGKEKGELEAIVGAEVTLEDGSVLPILVENRIGYQNLCRMLTQAHLRAEKGKSAVRWDELPQFAEGLIALTGDIEGPLIRALTGPCSSRRKETPSISEKESRQSLLTSTATAEQRFQDSTPNAVLTHLTRAFGPERVYVEIQRHHLRDEQRINSALIDLAHHHHLPLLATNGACYAVPGSRSVLDVLTCIRHHTHLDAAGKLLEQNSERYLKTPRQMRELFHDLPQAVTNTLRLADRLQFRLEDLGYEFPRYPVPEGETMESFLRLATYDGARDRYKSGIPPNVTAQLERELDLINRLGFAGYFLIVWDIVRFCRENNIMAQGRGSAANSAVCYCLHITAVDAVKSKLLFERFLSEGRKSWPDIDIDLPSGDRRERVIQEVYRRYGRHGAAMTANVITYRGRSAARELGKALNISGDVLDRFSALFANGDFPHTLGLSSQMEQAGLPKLHPRAAIFAELYPRIYGLPRHLGQHSGGMVICQDKLDAVVPLENASMPGRTVIQWDKEDCEEMGIIKVDLLGLGMMSVLQDAVELTRQRGHPVDIAHLPQDDKPTFELMEKADTVGVFQIESRAQMATLPRMKPNCFYDVAIEVAIIRPGPIQGDLTHPFLKRRAKKEDVTYYDKDLEPILKPILERTLGVPLFQEQMLAMAMKLADFSGSEAEELRRALSFHRSQERMEKVEKKLRTALEQRGHSAKVIKPVLAAISSFALYGFPESHAISFALLAYASAYLKVHYAPEFYASLLNNQPMGFYSSATLIKDARRRGVKFRPVCVARSQWDCIIEADDAIRLGFRVVRGLSATNGQRLLAQRASAPFTSMDDFKRRVRLNNDELRTLAEIGALNCFAAHRRDAMWEAEKIVRDDDLLAHPTVAADANHSPMSPPSPLAPMTMPERLRADYIGMQLTTGTHPMALLRCRLPDVWRAADLPKARHGDRIRIAGNVICRQRPGTAKGFVFISLEDETGISNAIISPPLFEAQRLLITEEPFLLIEGELQNVENVIHVRADKIARLHEEQLVGTQSYDFH